MRLFAPLLIAAVVLAMPGKSIGQFMIQGRVIDSKTKSPLPFVNIYSPELKLGGATDIDGRFKIFLDRTPSYLEFSAVGFQKAIVPVDDLHVSAIQMTESPIQLKEVTIKSDDSIARIVIQKAVMNKRRNNPNSLASFRFNTYNKLYSTLEDINLDSVEKGHSESAVNNFLNKNHLFVSESFTSKSHLKPNYHREIVLANRFSGFKDPMFTVLASSFHPFSFYENQVRILDNNYLSPLSDNSWAYYRFFLENTIYRNQDTLFVISFLPRRKNSTHFFSGVLAVSSDGYPLENIQCESDDKNALISFKLTQLYSKHGSVSFPEQLNTTLHFNRYKLSRRNLIFVYKGYLQNIETNPDLTPKDFNDLNLEFDKTANSRSNEYWNKIRKDSVSVRDDNTYKFYDSLSVKSKNSLEKWHAVYQSLVLKKVAGRYFDLNLDKLYKYNQYENIRPGIGITSSPKISEIITAGAYVGYGTQDRAIKYSASFSIRLHKRSSSQFILRYSQDIAESASSAFGSNPQPAATDVRQWQVTRMDSIKSWQAEYSIRPAPYLWLSANISSKVIDPTYPYRYSDGVETMNQFRVTMPEINLSYIKGQSKIQVGSGAVDVKPGYPAIELSLGKAFKDLFDGNSSFTKFQFHFLHSANLRGLGNLMVSLRTGYIDGPSPYPFLFSGTGSLSNSFLDHIYVKNTFQVLGLNEFTSNRYFSLFISQSVGTLYNTKVSRPEIKLIQALTFGKLSNQLDHSFVNLTAPEKGYFESGLLAENLIRFNYLNLFYWGLGCGVFYRYGEYQLPAKNDNIVLKACVNLSF